MGGGVEVKIMCEYFVNMLVPQLWCLWWVLL